MSEAWRKVELGEICDIALGGTPARKTSRFWDVERKSGNVWLSIADIPKDALSWVSDSKEYLSNEGAENVQLVKQGTLLLSFKLSIGRVCFAGQDLRTNEAIAALSVNEQAGVDKRYLAWFLWGQDWNAIAANDEKLKGKTLNKGKLKEVRVDLPSLPEQKRIVAILDEAFASIDTAIANTEKNLVNANELFDRYLNSLFDDPNRQWSGKKLGDLGTVQTGNTPKTAEKGNYGNYVPFIKPGDFLGGGSLNYSNQALSRRGAEKARVLPKGAVLMVCIGATIGKAGYTEKEITTNQQINALSPDEEYSAKFIYYQMLSDRFQRDVMSSAGQTTLPIISKKKWSNIEIRVPPTFSGQCALVEKLDELDLEIRRLSRNYRLKRANLEEFKQSLLQKAFTGELTAAEVETEAREAVA